MSQEERDCLKRAKAGSMSQRVAGEKIGVSARWVRKILPSMTKWGEAVVVHGLRGRPSNRKLSAEMKRQALAILKHSLIPRLQFAVQPEFHAHPPAAHPRL